MLEKIPIVITENIAKLEPPVLYLGAGHADWKICVPVDILKNELNGSVIDLSE